MRLITASELVNKSLAQLNALYQIVSEELGETEPADSDRANMIASLANISRAIAALRMRAPRL